VAMLPEDTSDVEVLREAVPPRGISGSAPSAEEPVLGVARVGELGAATGSSALERRASEL